MIILHTPMPATDWLSASIGLALCVVAAFMSWGEVARFRKVRRLLRLRDRLGYLVDQADSRLPLPEHTWVWRGLSYGVLWTANRLLPRRVIASYRALLLRAGLADNGAIITLLSAKLVLSLGFGVVGALAAIESLPTIPNAAIPIGLAAWFVGYLTPDIWLRHHTYVRGKKIASAIPPALDLLVIALEAGLSFESAVTSLTEALEDNLFAELMRTYLKLRDVGYTRRDALQWISDRQEVPEFRAFSGVVSQGQQMGVGIAHILRETSVDMRVRQRQNATEQVRSASVKMLFPLITCILPAMFIILLAPIFRSIAENFK